MSTPEPQAPEQVAARISEEIAGIHRESYGETVRGIETHLLDDAVLCVIDMAVLPHERTILDSGRGTEAIRQTRQQFQEAIGATFIAAVEHMTGRKVIGFISDTHFEPPFTIEFFRLAPAV